MFISSSYKKRAGITLTETLFSAWIITLVLVGILLIFVQTVDMSKRIDYEYIAINLAKSRLERAKGVIETSGFASLTPENFDETDKILDANGNPDLNGDFKRSTAVTTSYSGDARQTLVDTSVTYKYRNQWKETVAVTMSTIFADIG